MINGLGIVGWGVGGIEVEAGCRATGLFSDARCRSADGRFLGEGVTATDLALTVTEMLREAKVVGKFVEFYGEAPKTCRSPIVQLLPTWLPSTGRHGLFPDRR